MKAFSLKRKSNSIMYHVNCLVFLVHIDNSEVILTHNLFFYSQMVNAPRHELQTHTANELCWSYSLCCNYSALVLLYEHRHTIIGMNVQISRLSGLAWALGLQSDYLCI